MPARRPVPQRVCQYCAHIWHTPKLPGRPQVVCGACLVEFLARDRVADSPVMGPWLVHQHCLVCADVLDPVRPGVWVCSNRCRAWRARTRERFGSSVPFWNEADPIPAWLEALPVEDQVRVVAVLGPYLTPAEEALLRAHVPGDFLEWVHFEIRSSPTPFQDRISGSPAPPPPSVPEPMRGVLSFSASGAAPALPKPTLRRPERPPAPLVSPTLRVPGRSAGPGRAAMQSEPSPSPATAHPPGAPSGHWPADAPSTPSPSAATVDLPGAPSGHPPAGPPSTPAATQSGPSPSSATVDPPRAPSEDPPADLPSTPAAPAPLPPRSRFAPPVLHPPRPRSDAD